MPQALKATTGAFKDSIALILHYDGMNSISCSLDEPWFHRELSLASRAAGRAHALILLPHNLGSVEKFQTVGNEAFEALRPSLRFVAQVIWIQRFDCYQVIFSTNPRFSKGLTTPLTDYHHLPVVK